MRSKRFPIKLSAVIAGLAFFAPAVPAQTELRLDKEIVIQAPVEAVWRAWTTEQGLEAVSPASRIDLRLGGDYAWFLDGEPDAAGRRGSEGSRVLSFIPREMLAFAWTFPPSVPGLRAAGATTQVVVRLQPAGEGHTRVRLVALGWQEGEEWERGHAYFDRAWDAVLGRMKESLESASPESRPPLPRAESSWRDGRVRVTALAAREQRQEFVVELPAPPSEVWELLTTEQGFRRLGATEPAVELRPGGPYQLRPGANNRVLAFVPGEMLSTSGSAPPEYPEVRQGGTWSAIYLEPVGDDRATLLRMVLIGWRPGEREWDDAFDYFLRNNAIFLNHLHSLFEREKTTKED